MDVLIISANSLSFILDYKIPLIKSAVKLYPRIKIVIAIPSNKYNSYQSESYKSFLEATKEHIVIDNLQRSISPLSLILNIYLFLKLSYIYRKSKKIVFVSHTASINLALFFSNLLLWNNTKNLYRYFITGFGPSKIRRGFRSRILGRIYIKSMQIASTLINNRVFTLNSQDRDVIQDFSIKRDVIVIRESGILKENILKINNYELEKGNLKNLKIVYIGRYLLEKGINDISLISFYLNAANINHNITAYGDYDESNSSSVNPTQIKSLTTENLKFKSSKPYPKIFKDAHIVIFPSLREGHPRFLLEAMSFQCIPVVSPNPGLDVDVIHLFNGLISVTRSPSSLASSIINLVKSPSLYKELKEGCKEYCISLSKINIADENIRMILN